MKTRAPSDTPAETPAFRSAAPAGRIPWRPAVLVAGDIVSFLVFASAGQTSHHEARTLGSIVTTAFPFALGWFLVSPFVGAFRERFTRAVPAMLKRTELAWLCAWPAALVLRVLFAPDHQMPVSFAIVILLANAVFLGIWRGVFALVASRFTR